MTIRILRNPPMVSSRTNVGKEYGKLGKHVSGTVSKIGVRIRGRRSR